MTPPNLIPKWAGTFHNYTHYVRHHEALKPFTKGALFFDVQGRQVKTHGDFLQAQYRRAYPVRWFFEMEAVDA